MTTSTPEPAAGGRKAQKTTAAPAQKTTAAPAAESAPPKPRDIPEVKQAGPVSEDAVTRSLVSSLTEKLFGGDALALVSHLVTEHDVDPVELDELKTRVAAAKNKEGNR